MNNTVKRVWAFVMALCLLFTMAPAMAEVAEPTTPVCPHDYVEVEVLREGTCKSAGVYKEKCSLCKEERYVTREGHTYEFVIEDATCTSPMKMGKKCSLCGVLEGGKTELDPVAGSTPLDHDLDMENGKRVEASCKNNAGMEYKCLRCGAAVVIADDPDAPTASHTRSEAFDVPATCSDVAYTGRVICTVCDTIIEKGTAGTAKDPKVHNPVDGDVVKAPTCDLPGVGKLVCKDCGVLTGYKSLPAAHTIKKVFVKENNCGVDGKAYDMCTACDYKSEEYTEPATTKHTYVEVFEVATCEHKDRSAEKCFVCGQYKPNSIKEVENSVQLQHAFDAGVEVEATCEHPAGTLKTCKMCGKTNAELGLMEGDTAAHKYEEDKSIYPTCQKDGIVGKMVCTVCGETDPNNQGTATAKSNDYHVEVLVEELKETTCTTDGVGKYGCKYCKTYEVYKSIEGKHDYQPVEVKPATCKVAGEQFTRCTVCGDETEVVEVPATGKHTWVENVFKPANCLEADRYGAECKVCGEFRKTADVEGSTALDHTWDAGVQITEPTCEYGTGLLKTCTVCKATNAAELAEGKLEHQSEEDMSVRATCKAAGIQGKMICKLCGKVTDEGRPEAINPNNHVEYVVKVEKEATCTTVGVGKYGCKLCPVDLGYKVIPAEHKMETVVTLEPTCDKAGSQYRFCTVCKVEEPATEIPATNEHVEVEVFKAADCENPDRYGKECVLCGKFTKIGDVAGSVALDHKWDEGVEVKATCTEPEGLKKTCTVCGKTKVDAKVGGQGALQHDMKAVTAVAPNCQTGGYVGAAKCSRCDYEVKGTYTEAKDPANHNIVLLETVKEDTCTSDGVGLYGCSLCGQSKQYKVIKGEHKLVDEIVLAPTCNTAGEKYEVCTRCDYKSEKIAIDATNEHAWETVFEAATCEHADQYGQKCKVCGTVNGTMTAVQGSNKLPHNVDVIDVAADCDYAAGTKIFCKDCEWFEIQDAEGNKVAEGTGLGHKYVENKAVAPTCKTAGIKDQYICERCNKIDPERQGTKSEAIETAHVEELVDTIREATCTTAGAGEYGCKICGKFLRYGVIAAAHTKEDEIIKPATCGQDGKKIEKCTKCDWKSEEITITASGEHTYTAKFMDADCLKAARFGDVCTVCGHEKNIVPVEGSTAKGHAYEVSKELKASCTNTAGYEMVCSRCDAKSFVPFDSTAEAPGHQWVADDFAGNCGEEALTGRYTCSVCKAVDPERPGVKGDKDATKHADNEGEVVKEATCSVPGTKKISCKYCDTFIRYETYTAKHTFGADQVDKTSSCVYHECSVCGAVEIVNSFATTTCTHNFVVVKAVAATATEDGMTAGKKCSACGLVLYGCDVIPATKCEHVAGDVVIENEVEATCTTDGSYDEVVYCTVCEAKISSEHKIVVAAGHIEEDIPAVEAGCKTEGKTAGKKCTVCQEVTVEPTVVPATGEHKFVTVEGYDATCTEDGLTDGTVCDCGEIGEAQTVIPAKGHTFEKVEGTPATCTEDGLTDGTKCACGEIGEAQTVIPAKGHTFEKVAGKAATCTEDGLTDGTKCACGVVGEAQETIPAKGHSYTKSYDFNADGTKKVITYTCGCGHTYSEETDL